MQNRASWKAFNSLTHPLSVGAVILLLLNDHLFRIYAPSWWTGKLGDFTWLIFAPLICALIFAWLIPRRLPNHVSWVGRASFGFIGAWFAMAKTVPAVQHATNSALSAIIGWQTSLRLDPTDLLTLPALYIGWWVWQHAPETPPNLRPYGWLVVGIGIFATLATSPGYYFYDYGVSCVFSENENVYAWGDVYTGGFVSLDGGLSWTEINADDSPVGQQVACQRNLRPITWELSAGSLLFSFTDRTRIDVSTDNSETWQQEWDFSFLTDERRRLYFDHFDPAFTGKYSVGPFDAVFDEASQNLIVAMGHDGVLVRDNLGNWQWVAVGEYRYQPEVFADLASRIALLRDKLWVSFVLFLVGVASISAPYRPFTDWRVYIFGLFYWGGWVTANYFTIAPNSFLSFTDLLIVPLAFVSWFSLFQIANRYYDCSHERDDARRIFAIVAGFSLFTSCLYLLPYLLWINGTIPQFRFAWESSIILAIISVYAFGTWVRRRYFAHLKKQPPKEINSRTTLEDLFHPD